MEKFFLQISKNMNKYLILLSLFILILSHGDHGGDEHKPEDKIPGIVDVDSSNVDEVFNGKKHVWAGKLFS